MNQYRLLTTMCLMMLVIFVVGPSISPPSEPTKNLPQKLSRGEIARILHAKLSNEPQSAHDWLDELPRGQFVDIPADGNPFYKHIEKIQIASGNACTKPNPRTFCPTEMIMRLGMVKFVVKQQ